MAGRSSPALFELIRDKGSAMQGPQVPRAGMPAGSAEPAPEAAAPPAAPKPVIRLKLAPAPEPEAPEPPEAVREPVEVPKLVRPEARPPREPSVVAAGFDLQRRLSIPMNAVFLGMAGLIIVGVVVWTISWKLSSSRTNAEWVEKIAPEMSSSVRDPLRPEVPVNSGLVTPGTKAPATPAKPGRETAGGDRQAGAAKPPAPVPAAGGDTRIPGLNYLALAAFLDGPTSDRLVAFLGSGGLPAIAIPVDPKAGQGKNAGLFKVYAAKGIAGKDIRAGTAEVKELKDLAARLGAAWKREQKGGTDFDDMFWEKHTP